MKSSDTFMDEVKDILGGNRLEDVTWLCSLSESELDMLISLKIMLIQRAKVIGHESLAENFDLKILRALGFILMEYLKGKGKDLSLGPDDPAAFMDHCKLLKCNVEEIVSLEELKALIGPDSKNRLAKRLDKMKPHHGAHGIPMGTKRGRRWG
ncbi:uncharacterized protein LOC109004735 isoform X2 [Juglans regia]|uniref:Uncharacterized protein LOC109004735 isoform X2 n=1 Tax=Juglans regia TaxID=51240 RepID=A0A6P9ES13_JUGRE|nr:uncharacterized protein LOC109004735 isoform X2 [Juglans regia]